MSSPTMKVVVPFRADWPERQRNFDAVVAWWQSIGFDPVVADSQPGTFNRAQARNTGAVLAGDWDVVVFGDADTVGTPSSVHRGAERAHEKQAAVWPFDSFEGLSEVSTERWVAGQRSGLKVVKRKDYAPGGILAIARRAFERVGGFDEGFVGWGYEDVAFDRACQTLLPTYRLKGKITHLWHPYDPTRHKKDQNYIANRRRVELYRQAEGKPEAMDRLLNDLEVVWPKA